MAAIPETPQDKAVDLVRRAEQVKGQLLQVPGRGSKPINTEKCVNELIHSVMVDEEYTAVAAHIDEHMKKVIVRGEYVDLTRLLPKDRVMVEEDQRMEMVNRGGLSYWVPVSDRSSSSISNIARWEEAFRVYSRIYTEGNPLRATEFIQYNHIIHKAALEFPWESVYAYDREFRVYMSKFPNRNWGIILQQAWTLKMRRSISRDSYNNQGRNGGNRRNLCWKFNQGCCNYKIGHKFDHKCTICNRWGHGAHNCIRGRGGESNPNHEYHDSETGERHWRSRYHQDNRQYERRD